MCLSYISRSLITKDMMTQGIRAKAIEVMMPKSKAYPSYTLLSKTWKVGRGDVIVMKSASFLAVFMIDW